MTATSLVTYLLHYAIARTVYDWLFDRGTVQPEHIVLVIGGLLALVALYACAGMLTGGGMFQEERRGYRLQRGRERARERAARRAREHKVHDE